MKLGLLSDPARIAVIVLPCDRIKNIAERYQCASFRERDHKCSTGIRDEEHIALIDSCPASNARPIYAETIFERALLEHIDRIRDVLSEAGDICKAQIHLPRVILFRKL